MKPITLLVVILLSCVPAWAQDYTLEPDHYDYDHEDGIDDPGSPTNPWIIRDEWGREVGQAVEQQDPWKGNVRPDWKYGEPRH